MSPTSRTRPAGRTQVLNPVVARLTIAGLLGGRRLVALVALPVVLLAVAVVVRLVGGLDEVAAAGVLDQLGLGLVLPVLCVVVGTSVVGPEIEDGSIIYLLSKPLSRGAIARTKLLVAVATTWVLGALPVGIAALVLPGTGLEAALIYAVVAAVAAVAYCAVFLLLGVLTGNAVVIGLLYALIWETTVSAIVPGARALSIRQWAVSVGEELLGADADRLGLTSEVSTVVAVVLLVVITLGATWWATRRLRALSLTGPE